ncbi:hypothetical protein QFC21_000174 [Naganishia friedmannii]|uniref:Uncharacterized protein n=1 Tax=Naganishia friedmannii TaxID=89922 RepID=A0ACC2WCE2_9TREE|nr:hypothetical protein QFC21_000174 [Naganishia friedmannii]
MLQQGSDGLKHGTIEADNGTILTATREVLGVAKTPPGTISGEQKLLLGTPKPHREEILASPVTTTDNVGPPVRRMESPGVATAAITAEESNVLVSPTAAIGHFHKPFAITITTSRFLQAIRALCGDTRISTAILEQVRATMVTKGHLDTEFGPHFQQLVNDAVSKGLVKLHEDGRVSLRDCCSEEKQVA